MSDQKPDSHSLTSASVFVEEGMLRTDDLNRHAYLVSEGIVSGGEAFAYNASSEKTEEEKEADELRKETAEAAAEIQAEMLEEAFGHDEPTFQTVSFVNDGYGGYQNITITNANGDYLGGSCSAPWATASADAAGSTGSFAAVAQPEDASRGIASASFAGVASGAYISPSLTPTLGPKPVYLMTDAERSNASFAELSGTEAPFSPFTSTLDTKPNGLKEAPLSVFTPKPARNDFTFELAM